MIKHPKNHLLEVKIDYIDIMTYRGYKHFSNEIFRRELDEKLSKFGIHNIEFE